MCHYTLATTAAVDDVAFAPLHTSDPAPTLSDSPAAQPAAAPALTVLALLRTGEAVLHAADGTAATPLGTCNLKEALKLAEVRIGYFTCFYKRRIALTVV